MAGKGKQLWGFLKRKRLRAADAVCLAIFISCVYFVSRHSFSYSLGLEPEAAIEAPWLVKADKSGSLYVVDKGKMRILKITDNEVERVIHGGAPSGDTFWCADNIAVSDGGDVYVQETGWGKTGLSLDYESILHYDRNGKSLGVCHKVDYDGIYADKHRLFGLSWKEDGLYFVEADEYGFSLKRMDLDGGAPEEVFSADMEDAITMVQDFVINADGTGVFVIDKRGRLYKAAEGEVRLFWELGDSGAGEGGEKTALYRGTLGAGDSVYVTEIASGRLLFFGHENGYRPQEVLLGPQMWNASYTVLADGGWRLDYVADGGVGSVLGSAETLEGVGYEGLPETGSAILAGQEAAVRYSYPKSAAYLAREIFYHAMAAAAAITALYLLARAAAVVFTLSYGNTQKVGMLVVSTVIVVSFILVYGLMEEFRGIYRGELLAKLSMTAQIAANGMDEEKLDDIEPPQNFMNESYLVLWNELNTVFDRDYGYGEDIYCNILRYDGEKGYAVIYLDNSIGTYYPLTEEETKQVRQVYETGDSVISDVRIETGSYIYVMTPILGGDGRVAGVVSVGTLSDVIDSKIAKMMKGIAISMVMIILAIMFLFGEVLSFFDLRDQYRQSAHGKRRAVPMHVVRLVVFVAFMAFNMATSFLPVYILRFVSDGMGIPTALASSLPMTMNLVFVGLTSLACPCLITRLGFGPLAAASGFTALCGDLLMANARSYGMVAAGLSLNGIGAGMIVNSIHIFMASVSGDGENGEVFPIFNAASLAGVNCGMLFGSALAQRMGQGRVFLVSAASWAFVALVFVAVRQGFAAGGSLGNGGGGKKESMVSLVLSPGILKFMLCMQIPYIIMNSFTYYYVPIYGNGQGLTENETSLLIITCALCSAYLSVAMSNYMAARFGDRAMYISSILTFMGLLFFAWHMTLPSLAVALVLIGIANSFGSSSRISCFIRMPASVRCGEEQAMGAYDFVDNLGESMGSIIFAGIISVGFRSGILGLVGCVGGLNAIYALLGCGGDKKTGSKNVSQETGAS